MEPQGFGSAGGFGSGGFGSGGGFGSESIGGVDNKIALDTVTGLEELAKENGYEESKVMNAISGLGRVLNYGTANVAGAVRGALTGEGILKGRARGVEENIGFADVYNDIFGKADTRGEKIAVGIGGFAADVLFDPLTYITFGASAGLKIGGKALSKGGTKLAQKTQKDLIKSTYETLLKDGYSEGKARRVAQISAERATNDVFSKVMETGTIAKEEIAAITKEATEKAAGRKFSVKQADKFLEEVIKTKDIDNIRMMGTKLIDEGGIKWFGQTLVKGETLKNTAVGRAGRRLGETEIAVAVKNTLGRLFVRGYGQNKDILEITDAMGLATKRAILARHKQVEELFEGVTEPESVEFFNAAFQKRLEVLGATKEIQQKTIKALNKAFPELKVKDEESALRVLESLDDVHHKQIAKMHNEMEKISKEFFAQRQRDIAEGTKIEGAEILEQGAQGSFAKIDRLNERLREAKNLLKEARREAGSTKKARTLDEISVELTDENAFAVANKLVRFEEERLTEQIDNILSKIENMKAEGLQSVSKGAKKGKKATQAEQLMQLDELVKKLERDYNTKSRELARIVNAKRTAKLRQRAEQLRFFHPNGQPNEKLNKLADKMFEGNDSIMAQHARDAGISEEDAYKFYLPSKFRDQTEVKGFAMGKYISSAKTPFKEQFNGVANELLIRDAKEATKRGFLDVDMAKIQSKGIRQAFNAMGIKDEAGNLVKEMDPTTAKSMGLKRVTRKTIDGEVSAYLPKEIAEQMNDFLGKDSLKSLDDAARALGFDWATGLFKGYVTSLFPAFHVRNMIGNEFQLFIQHGVDVFNPANQADAAALAMGKNLSKKFTTKTGKVMTLGELRDQVIRETDFLDEGAFGDTELMLRGIEEGGTFNPFSRNNIALRTGQKVGQTLEAQSKLFSILTGVKEGKSIKQAIEEAEKVLFNYNKLTDFERVIMRRLIPFYTFARKNFELQVKTLATQPGKVASQLKFINGVGNAIGEPMTDDDEEGLPNWVKSSLGFKAGANQYGQSTFITGLGLPIEEFLMRFSGDKGFIWNSVTDTMTRMNPLIKFPLERGTGVDFFRGQPITEISNAGDLKPLLEALPNDVEEEFKSLLQYQEREVNLYVNGEVVGTKTKVTANPYALHLFRNLPTARFQSSVGSLYDNEETGLMTLTRMLTGVRGWTIDQEEQRFFNELEKRDKLQSFLVRMGVIGIKEIPFEKQSEPEQEETSFGEDGGFGQ